MRRMRVPWQILLSLHRELPVRPYRCPHREPPESRRRQDTTGCVLDHILYPYIVVLDLWVTPNREAASGSPDECPIQARTAPAPALRPDLRAERTWAVQRGREDLGPGRGTDSIRDRLRYHGAVKVRHAMAIIERDGWRLVATRGSHRQYKHPSRPGRVTIAGHLNDDLAPGTWNSIRKQAGQKGEEPNAPVPGRD